MKLTTVSGLYTLIKKSPVETLYSDVLKQKNINLDIKRDDLIHPVISGNKWRKLKYLLHEVEAQGYRKLAAMGGPYSNFIHALSYVCYLLGWECDLYIRAYPEQKLTPTLEDCKKWHANIIYVDRTTFKELREAPPVLPDDVFWMTEGGMHDLALDGLKEIVEELDCPYDYIVISTATGTSVAGLIDGVADDGGGAIVLGVSVLNNAQQQELNISQLQRSKNTQWSVVEGYEFGGFAKKDQVLEQFVEEFYQQHMIPLEPVYSGKSFYAVMDLVGKNYFPNDSRVLLIHCGGLQGART